MDCEILSLAGAAGIWHANRTEVAEAWAVRNDNFVLGDEGFADASELDWYLVEQYPVARLQHVPDAAWLSEENEHLDGRYSDMLSGHIQLPLVVMDDGQAGFIWDGYHRAAAALAAGVASVPVIVGVKRPELAPVLYHGSGAIRSEFRKGFGDDRGGNLLPQAFFFSPDRAIATTYGEVVTGARLLMERPYVARTYRDFVHLEVEDAEAMLKTEGYDSCVLYTTPGEPPEYVVFDPSQIHIVDLDNDPEEDEECPMRP